MAGLDILTVSPIVLLLVAVGVLVFLKMLKYILILVLLVGIYYAAKFGMIPGVAPF